MILTPVQLIAIATDLRAQADMLDPPVPPPPISFAGRSLVDPKVWTTAFEDDFTTLAPEGSFLSTHSNWDAYPVTDQTTSKKGYYDPNKISVVDLPTGERVMQCRLAPGTENTNGQPSGCAPQPKLGGSAYNGTKGEKIELRAKVLKPAPGWHVANLGWPLKNANWPKFGEPDFWESGLSTSDTVGAHLHVQNGGSNGQGQVNYASSVPVTDWFTVGHERIAGKSYAWTLNATPVDPLTSTDLKSPYGIPNDFFRWVLQLEDDGSNPTEECIVVYNWVTIWTPVD